jgi:UDP-N-acetylglucosamine 2-epimerase (non-hydrolysing)
MSDRGPHGRQTADIMTRFEPLLEEDRPDVVVVVGDVNSTIACALGGVEARHPRGARRGRIAFRSIAPCPKR